MFAILKHYLDFSDEISDAVWKWKFWYCEIKYINIHKLCTTPNQYFQNDKFSSKIKSHGWVIHPSVRQTNRFQSSRMKYIPNYQRVISTNTEGATSCQRLIEQRLSNDFKKLTRITLGLLGQACNPIYSGHWGRKIKSSMKTPGERERKGGGKREQGPGLYPQQKTKQTPVFTTRYIMPFLILCVWVGVLPMCMYVHHTHAQCP